VDENGTPEEIPEWQEGAAAERLATEGEVTMKKLMIAVLAVTGVALAKRGP
jgi:hypothetical protein